MCSSLVSELTIYILSWAVSYVRFLIGLERREWKGRQIFFKSAYSKILSNSETYVPNKVYRLF